MTRNTPLAFLALPGIAGMGLMWLGARSAKKSSSALMGLGTEAEDLMQRNLLATQQFQTNALTANLVMVSLLAVPVLSAVGILWMIRKSR